jgi:hypothetical protein
MRCAQQAPPQALPPTFTNDAHSKAADMGESVCSLSRSDITPAHNVLSSNRDYVRHCAFEGLLQKRANFVQRKK